MDYKEENQEKIQVRISMAHLKKVCEKFWMDIKAGKKVIRQSKDEFLRDLEKW